LENKDLILVDKENQEVQLISVIESIIKKMNEKEIIEKSQARKIVGGFIETLIDKQDPFMTSLGTLGGDQSIHAVGLLLFVSFQLGYTFGSGAYNIKPEPQ
jgi:hypothetical protein